jgi:hypothetical protein
MPAVIIAGCKGLIVIESAAGNAIALERTFHRSR